MYHSGGKMGKIRIVPTKVRKILKMGKMKYVKGRSSLKKMSKKEIRKKMTEMSKEYGTKKDVSESVEAHSFKISGKVRSRTSSREKVDSENESVTLEYPDCVEKMSTTVLPDNVQSDCSSESLESAGGHSSESLTDSEEDNSMHENSADEETFKEKEDNNDSDCVVISDVDTISDGNSINRPNELRYDTITPSLKIPEAKAEFHHLSDKTYFLILRHPGQLYFRGTLLVTPVSGVTAFLGYEFTTGMKSHLVFSPKGISPLSFSTTGRSSQVKVTPKIPGLDKKILKRLGEKDSGVLIEPAAGEDWIKLSGFFNRLLKFNPLAPTKDAPGEADVDVEADLGVKIFQPSDCISSKSFHRESSEWNALSQEIWEYGQSKGLVRVMVFGGKGVGKSTFMRFLVNRWLTCCNEVKSTSHESGTILFLDFDPGQSEFVPPGCLSVTLVSEALLGPNYTHLQDPERMICLGELDVSRCPKWYLQCADDLVKFCSSEKFKGLPWFINTMGFCKGIGADLAAELIRICRPTHVIQLTSIWARRNFEPLNLLSWQMVMTRRGQKWNPDISDKVDQNIPEYSYHQLQSLAESSEKVGESSNKAGGIEDIDSQWGLPAWQSRELSILAYFSKVVEAPKYSVLDAVPHTLRLRDLVLSLPSAMVKPQYIKSVFNAALVALTSLGNEYGEKSAEADGKGVHNDNQQKPWQQFEKRVVESDPKVLFHMPLAPCFGFGLVRGIDDSKEEIHVITPLSCETMVNVDCLASGPKVGSIPAPIMMDSLKESNEKDAPYLMKKDRRTEMNRFAPRVFQPHLANPGAKRSKH